MTSHVEAEARRLWEDGVGYRRVAKELDISPWKARRLLEDFRRGDSDPAPGVAGGARFEAKGDEATAEAKRSRIRTLDELLTAADVDLDEWAVDRWVANKWETAARDANGDLIVEPLHQVKAWLKRRAPLETESRIHAIRDAAVDVMRTAGRQGRRLRAPKERDGLLLEVSAPDLHLGKLAWAEETGQPYDLDRAEAAFKSAVHDALDKATRFPVARVVFIVGNDLLHVDNSENTTTRGTRQDVAGKWQHAFRRALQLMLWAIDLLRELDVPVDVITIPGNHARVLEQAIGEALAAAYLRDDGVSVDASVRTRKPYEWGNVLIGYTHGDSEKHADLPLLMASEWPEAWGRTRIREVHVGHLHHRRASRSSFRRLEEVAESKGVVVRILPSLSAVDAWHDANGYTGSLRACEAYLWDRERGLELLVTGHPDAA